MRIFLFLVGLKLLLSSCGIESRVEVTVTNPSDFERVAQTVEIPFSDLVAKIDGLTTSNVVVECRDGLQIPSQVTYDSLLIFQVNISPNGGTSVYITKGERENYESKVYGRLVPERMDDWAWENDVIAFRAYGPALKATGEISGGVDIWVKRTADLIVDKWYGHGDYHTDHGDGLDFYKVGRTLGAGASTPMLDGKLVFGDNFVSAKLLDAGPVRTTVRMFYDSLTVGEDVVVEERTISLDAGSHFNRFKVKYDGDFDEIDVVSGVVIAKGAKTEFVDEVASIVHPSDPKNGTIYIGLVKPSAHKAIEIDNHFGVSTRLTPGQTVEYYCGAYWDHELKTVPNFDWWHKQVELDSRKYNEHISVKFK